MGIYNLGSLAVDALELVTVSDNISGTMLKVAHRAVLHAENYTGQAIGSVAIAEKYQPALIDLTIAEALKASEGESSSQESIRLGDWHIKSSTGGESSSSSSYREDGESKLRELGHKVRAFRTY